MVCHSFLFILCIFLQSEVHRKEEELEMRRQELHRVREQNHGYQERLQSKSKGDRLGASPVKGSPKTVGSSPSLSPSHSRPNSFVSLSSASDNHEDEGNSHSIFMDLVKVNDNF